MKLPRWLHLICLGLLVAACLVLASCRKHTSPQAARQSRLNWNLDGLIGAYHQTGNTNAKWDEPVEGALTEFAHLRSSGAATPDEDSIHIIGTSCRTAVEAGCDDPMIRYLYIRFYLYQTDSPQDMAKALCDVALDLQKSPYPVIQKFFAAIIAMDQLIYAYGTNVQSVPALHQIEPLLQNIFPIVQDNATPPEEAYQVCKQALKEFNWDSNNYVQAWSSIEGPIFNNWPKESVSWLLKGEAYYHMAWLARGGGYAKDIGQERWKSFFDRLSVAEEALKKAWKLDAKDARIPTLMISVDEGQEKKRDDMELWFRRAMALDPKNYDACKNKLHYLYPQWYGSRDDMIAFGKECVSSTNWGGSVPLILVDAHYDYATFSLDTDAAREAYWKHPEVWEDIRSAYDRFFALNPDAAGIYKNYAWYAWHAQQWDAFNELAPKVRPEDYNFFGGKDEFEKMVQLAKARAESAAAKP